MAGQLLGINAKLYRNGATFGSPTWGTALPRLSDVAVDLSWNRATNATRGSTIERGGKTTGKLQITAKHEQDLTDTDFLAIWAALISNTASLDILVLNASNSTNGARGFRGEMDVSANKDNQAVGDVLIYDLTFEPQATANALQTCVVATGAPVFTTFAS
jgi:hypothetical protein